MYVSAEGLPLQTSGHQAMAGDALVEVVERAVGRILRRVCRRELGQDQVISDVTDGVALKGAR